MPTRKPSLTRTEDNEDNGGWRFWDQLPENWRADQRIHPVNPFVRFVGFCEMRSVGAQNASAAAFGRSANSFDVSAGSFGLSVSSFDVSVGFSDASAANYDASDRNHNTPAE